MSPAAPPPDRLAALSSLLDDASPAVRAALRKEFVALGPPALEWLRRLAGRPGDPLAPHASWFLRELGQGDPALEFLDFIRSRIYELETGALLLARTSLQGRDPSWVGGRLDELGARVRELAGEEAKPRETCRILNRVLFHEYGLRGNQEDFTDPRNSFIDQVLEHRQGLPITLSIIYLLVAARAGLDLDPVGVPGHFMVGCFAEDRPFYIDTYHQGVFRSADEVLQMLRRNNISPRPGDLEPTPVGEVLCRCCRNLVSHYHAAGEAERSVLFGRFVEEFERQRSPGRGS